MSIPDKLYFKIGEVSEIVGVEPYVLRYWESEFNILRPSRTKSKQRLYRRKDLEFVLKIKKLLYEDQFTIAGARNKLKEHTPQTTASKSKERNLLKDVKDELKMIKDILG